VCVCAVLERYRERLSDRDVTVMAGNVAVIPCTAVSHSAPPALTQFEFNNARLRLTSTLRYVTSRRYRRRRINESADSLFD